MAGERQRSGGQGGRREDKADGLIRRGDKAREKNAEDEGELARRGRSRGGGVTGVGGTGRRGCGTQGSRGCGVRTQP
ncbi:hypothetical protein CDT93_21750, partial [Cronobacter sakazakii]